MSYERNNMDEDFGSNEFRHDEIAELAYRFWEGRGRPVGSPEEDWFRAELELLLRAAAAEGSEIPEPVL